MKTIHVLVYTRVVALPHSDEDQCQLDSLLQLIGPEAPGLVHSQPPYRNVTPLSATRRRTQLGMIVPS